jgi:hypothetical protein
MLYMTGIAASAPALSAAPRLRLLPSHDCAVVGEDRNDSPTVADRRALRLVPDAPTSDINQVLVAGRDSAQRATVLEELSESLPEDTTFEQASAFWEVLVRAPSSRMVVLSGELDDVPTASLMRMLGHRHPGLPVVSLDVPALV